jgi:hypothetical protein
MEKTSELGLKRTVLELEQKLDEAVDAETAIAVYKSADWVIDQLEVVKERAQALAEEDLRERGEDSLSTPIGSAAWTEPDESPVDENAWQEALARDASLQRLVRDFEDAQGALEQARVGYRRAPQRRLIVS